MFAEQAFESSHRRDDLCCLDSFGGYRYQRYTSKQNCKYQHKSKIFVVHTDGEKIRLCRNKVERTKNVARVRKIKKLNYKTVQLWTKADLWRQVSFAFSESYAWFQYPQ